MATKLKIVKITGTNWRNKLSYQKSWVGIWDEEYNFRHSHAFQIFGNEKDGMMGFSPREDYKFETMGEIEIPFELGEQISPLTNELE